MAYIEMYGDKEIFFRDVRFRLSEISDWVKAFIAQGNDKEAYFWAKESCRIARALPDLSGITLVHVTSAQSSLQAASTGLEHQHPQSE